MPRPRGDPCRCRRGDAARRRAGAGVPRIRHAAVARRDDARDPPLLGRRRARQRLRGTARGFCLVRTDRDPNPACGRRRHGIQDPRRAALRARLHRRRRNLRRRVLRGDQSGRGARTAGGVRDRQQRLGDFGARGGANRGATLAQKAVAAGIPGVQVDGNDVFGCGKWSPMRSSGARAAAVPRWSKR